MIDETVCWTIYQARNWLNWARPMRFAITILPMVVYLIVGWRAWKHYEKKSVSVEYYVTWRSLRWLLILLLPWAIAQVFSIAYFALCYSP